jgi:hypothetical protein
MEHGMEMMRLRGHFFGALTLAILSLACGSVNAKGSDGAAGELAHRHATLLAAAETTASHPIPELIAGFHDFPNYTLPGNAMTKEKLPAILMEDPT